MDMVSVKISELRGYALNWAVRKSTVARGMTINGMDIDSLEILSLLDHHNISVIRVTNGWAATYDGDVLGACEQTGHEYHDPRYSINADEVVHGSTMIEAGLRAIVIKLNSFPIWRPTKEFEVPAELWSL